MHTIYKCFLEGKHKVLTLSYDDGKLADRKLVAIFNQYGIKGTFHLNSGLIDQDEQRIPAAEIPELYKGHEVAAHTSTHPTIARCPMEQVIQQILEDRRHLEKLVGYTVRGLSYPNGSYNEAIQNILPHVGIEYARIVGNGENFGLPENLYAWQATCHHNHNLLRLGEEFINLHKKQYLYLMYVWGHSYEFDLDGNWDLIEQFCRNISHQNDIWYATNIEIVDYLKAAANLKFSVEGDLVYNPSVQSIWLSVDNTAIEVIGGTQMRLF